LSKKNDIGIDIIAEKNNQYIYVQCKNYETTICIQDLAGFFFFKTLFPNKTYKVFFNGNLSSRIKKLVDLREYTYLPMSTTINKIIVKDKDPSIMIPRDYQKEILSLYNNSTRFVVSLPCGMGKTFISFLIAKTFNNIIFFAPSRQLCIQTIELFSSGLPNHKCKLISCDGERDVNNFVFEKHNLLVSTFDSCDVIVKIIDKLVKNTLIIIDEFHNLSSNDLDNHKYPFYKILNSEHKILFMSATPKYLDKISIFGNNVYKYDWNKAIQMKYINDFEIVLPTKYYMEIDLNEFISLFDINNQKIKEIEYDNTRKMYFITRSILFNGNKKCIIYLTDTDNAVKCQKIIQWMSLLFGRTITTNIINYKTDKITRQDKNETNLLIQKNLEIELLKMKLELQEAKNKIKESESFSKKKT